MAKALRSSEKNIPKIAKNLCDQMLKDLERARRPTLEAVKCSLDNAVYNPKVGYLTPGPKKVKTELNVSSVQKLARTVFMLEILLNNLKTGAVNTKRELYYMAKGLIKSDPRLKPLDFDDQSESDAVIGFITEMLEVYREELNCFANDRGGQTYSQHLVVTETLPDGSKAEVDLSTLGTTPFQPKNKPQQ
ncbi:MAG: DNA topoisomerase VI, partial [Bdellovibrio sp.]